MRAFGFMLIMLLISAISIGVKATLMLVAATLVAWGLLILAYYAWGSFLDWLIEK